MRKIEIFAILLLYATTLSARDYHCCWKVPKKGSIENTVVLGDTASVKALENGVGKMKRNVKLIRHFESKSKQK